jgi:hypothetical protein
MMGCCCYSLFGHAFKRASDSPIAIATPLIVRTVTPYWPPLLGAGGNLGATDESTNPHPCVSPCSELGTPQKHSNGVQCCAKKQS